MKKFTIVAVIGDRTLKVTSDGTPEGTVFDGSDKDIKRAKATAHNHRLVRLGDIRDGKVARAGYDSPLALTAALYSISPQSTYLWRAPAEVGDFMEEKPRTLSITHEDA